jgi:hypothetical protein
MRSFLIIVLLSLTLASNSQEFNCQIQIDSRQIQGTDKQIYRTLQNALFEFLNNRTWTNVDFKQNERIEANFVITIQERQNDVFKATLNIVASRPVYNSAYSSPLLNYLDDNFDFQYVEFDPMEYQDNTFTSNITSVFAYYLYMILGMEFDTFSQGGGAPFYAKAESVISAAQSSGFSGWQSYESDKNRYWLTENYTNSRYDDLHTFLYQYHRMGMDNMYDNVDKARSTISQSINLLKNVYDEKPGLFALKLIIDAKRDEIINVFKEGKPDEQSNVINVMKEIDPANASEYSKITKN